MPIIWPWFGIKREAAASGKLKPAQSPALNVSNHPRASGTFGPATVPVPQDLLQPMQQLVDTDSKSLSTVSLSSRAFPVPALDDVSSMDFVITSIYSSSGAGAGSIQATTYFDHIEIRNSRGKVIIQVLTAQFHQLFKRFSEHTQDYTDTSVAVAATQTNTVGATATPRVYMNLPKEGAPYNLVVYYAPLSALGVFATNNGPAITAATGVTAATVTTQIFANYGHAGGLETHIISTTFPIGAGINELKNLVPVVGVGIDELILYGFAADADLDHILVQSMGTTQYPFLNQQQLAAIDQAAIQAARPVGVFWLITKTKLVFNPTASFQVFRTTGGTTTSITGIFVWNQPPE